MDPQTIMIIAGEASGDLHGAKLARSIKKRAGEADLFGIGSSAMQKEGVRLIADAAALSVIGITEVIAKLPSIFRAMGTVKNALKHCKPDLLILIDFPDFNLRAAAAAKRLNIPVLYYISPQIWAWRQNRVKKIKHLVDHMAVILPFEASFYQQHQVPVTFVGHPLLDSLPTEKPSGSVNNEPVIGLVPGSRGKEVALLLPVMLQAATIIKLRQPETRFMVSCAGSIDPEMVAQLVDRFAAGLDIEVVRGPVAQVFERCRVLVAASGTVTLEAALYGVPMVIVYKLSPLSYWLGKRLIKVKHIGLANLIVQKELLPELIQGKASPGAVADTVLDLMNDPAKLGQIKAELSILRDLLGGPGASDRVASIAMDLIRSWKT